MMKTIHEVKTLQELLALQDSLRGERDDFNDMIHTTGCHTLLKVGEADVQITSKREKSLTALLVEWAKESSTSLQEVDDKVKSLEKQL